MPYFLSLCFLFPLSHCLCAVHALAVLWWSIHRRRRRPMNDTIYGIVMTAARNELNFFATRTLAVPSCHDYAITFNDMRQCATTTIHRLRIYRDISHCEFILVFSNVQYDEDRKSNIPWQSSNPWFMPLMEEPSHFNMGQTTQRLSCSVMEKPHAGLYDYHGMLLSLSSYWTFACSSYVPRLFMI